MTKVLLADDDAEFLALIEQVLSDAGYEVVTAGNPADALNAFQRCHLDVAILDYKLHDGHQDDRSGLEVALQSDPHVPKIIVSDKAERRDVMQAVRTRSDGVPVAVRFVAKEDIDPDTTVLLDAIREALDTGKAWKRQARETIGPELQRDFRSVANTARFEALLHILANFVFVGVIVWATIRLHEGRFEMLLLIGGIIVGDIANVMLAHGKRVSLLARADRYHAELLQSRRFEQLLEAAESLSTPAEATALKTELIRAASSRWLRDSTADDD